MIIPLAIALMPIEPHTRYIDFIWHDPDHPSFSHSANVLDYSNNNHGAFVDLSAPRFLPVPVSGGRIFAWIAFSLPAIMVNYGYIISVFSDPLGLGWDLLGTADTHFKALIPDWIPVIQGIVLLAGLYLGVSRGFMAIKDLLPDSRTQIRTMVLPSVFAILAVNLLLKLYMG